MALPQQEATTVSQLRAALDDKPKASEILMLIAPLFQAFPSFPDGTTGEQKMQLFEVALEGRSRSSINAAVTDFIKGNVEKHDGRFLPPPPQVAKQALKRQTDLVDQLHKRKMRETEKPDPQAKPSKAPNEEKRRKLPSIAGIGTKPFPDPSFFRTLPPGSKYTANPPQITLPDGEVLSFDDWKERNKTTSAAA